jgi:DNA-binding NtrC family response regulator
MMRVSDVTANRRPMHVLVVDDDEKFRFLTERRLSNSRHRVECVATGEEALDRLSKQTFDVVLLDLRMPGMGGLETLRRIHDADLPCEVVVLTGEPDYDDCVEAMKAGAFHYLCKPVEPSLIEDTLRRAVDHYQLKRENAALRRMLAPGRAPEFIGGSPAVQRALGLAKQAAPTDARVMILGESGTGKGLLARVLHNLSRRSSKAFIDVHCGALADQLLESELFGHEKGAFTGALEKKPGLFELADEGTLFLDEFAEMSPDMQTKLLKVLDTGELRRVGGVRTLRVDVRVLVATNRDIDALVRQGRLREDLLHRVNVIRITIPPLRERPDDIPRFVEHFLAAHQRRGLAPKEVTPEALKALRAYPWPGNVRELANTVERLMILCPKRVIDLSDLPDNVRSPKLQAPLSETEMTLEDAERQHTLLVLDSVGWNQSRAARRLGIDRSTLSRKLRTWNETTRGT